MTLLLGNNLDLLRSLPDNSVDSIVTDPPYGLGKEPDALAMLRDWMEHGHHDVKSKKGFMGKEWDNFVPQPAQWKECLRVLKPGGHVLAFAGTRTQDLMALGMRIAGFEIRDLVAWIYGSGFPKVKTVLKPALEPITLARKPGKGILNIDECRVHADDAQEGRLRHGGGVAFAEGASGFKQDVKTSAPAGRWPANVIHDGSDEVLALFPESKGQQGDLKGHAKQRESPNGCYGKFPPAKDAAARNDSGSAARFFYCAKVSTKERNEGLDNIEIVMVKCSSWENEDQQAKLRVDTAQSPPKVIGVSGAPNNDASAWSMMLFGSSTTDPSPKECKCITGMKTNSTTESKTLNWLIRSLTNGGTGLAENDEMGGGSPAANAGPSITLTTSTNDKTASVLGAGDAMSKTLWQIRGNAGSPCDHPTLKPIALMCYLCRLVTPPGGTILDPWMGSGSTGKAAKLEGFDFIGMEREADYFRIAQARCGVDPLADIW